MAKAKTKIAKFKSLGDAFSRAKNGEEAAQKCLIGCLENFGCDHLANYRKEVPKWTSAWHGLQTYIGSLVGEYGESETRAEKEVLAELNCAREYSDDIQLS